MTAPVADLELCAVCGDPLPHVPYLSPLWVRMAHRTDGHCRDLSSSAGRVEVSRFPAGRRAPP